MSQQPNKVDPEVARLLSKLSPEDIEDFLAVRGAGSLGKQMGSQLKQGFAEVFAGLVIWALIWVVGGGLLILLAVLVSSLQH